MKVKDLLKMEVDIDVYDNVCDDIGIAFCGPMEVTESGAARFEVALNLDCTIKNDGRYCVCIVNVEDEFFPNLWKFKLKKAKELFYALAGYCDADDYDEWFKEVE